MKRADGRILVPLHAWTGLLAFSTVLLVSGWTGAESPALMIDRSRSIVDGPNRETILEQLKADLKIISKEERNALVQIDILCDPPSEIDAYLVEPLKGEAECDRAWQLYRIEFLKTGDGHREIDYQLSLFFYDKFQLFLASQRLRSIDSVTKSESRLGKSTPQTREEERQTEK
jgi:hypothetical protein